MQKKIRKIDIIACLVAVLVFVIVIVATIFSFINKEKKSTEKVLIATGQVFPVSDIVSEEMDQSLSKTPSERFASEETLNDIIFNVYSSGTLTPAGAGGFIQKSGDEWFIYTSGDITSLSDFNDSLKLITGLENINIEFSERSDGCIGINYGGYMTGTIDAGKNTYYIMGYYLDSGQACAYVTTNKEKIETGYNLITENVKTMLYEASVLEGTADDEDDSIIPADDPYLYELTHGAQYSNVKTNKAFTKMYLLFTCDHIKDINEIYIRRMKDRSIIKPADNEPHASEEIVFIVDNVDKDEEFQFVVFSETEGDKIDSCAVEYEDAMRLIKESESENAALDEQIKEVNEIVGISEENLYKADMQQQEQ